LSRLVVVVGLCLVSCQVAFAQWIGKQTGCYADSIAANPNRPTVANPADITQYGVLELEYGWDRVWPEHDLRQTSVSGLLKFGLFCDIELRWNINPYVWQTNNPDISGFSDGSLGFQTRLRHQTARVPTLSFGYAAKIPSASTANGLGTGRVDHSFTFLASKDVAHIHFDFNTTYFLIGRQQANGFDHNWQLNLAFSRPIHGPLQFTGEFYGDTELNRTSPGFASSLWALTYTIVPRLVIDGGFEGGLTSGGPHRHAFAGFTYSIANLYPGWRHRHSLP